MKIIVVTFLAVVFLSGCIGRDIDSVPVEISITNAPLILSCGDSLQIVTHIHNSTNSASIGFIAKADEIASVNESGLLIGKYPGVFNFYATHGDYDTLLSAYITAFAISHIELKRKPAFVRVGGTAPIDIHIFDIRDSLIATPVIPHYCSILGGCAVIGFDMENMPFIKGLYTGEGTLFVSLSSDFSPYLTDSTKIIAVDIPQIP